MVGVRMIRFDTKKDYELYNSKIEENAKLEQENKQLRDNIRQIDNSVDKLQKQLIKEKDNWNIIKQEMLKIRQSTFSKYNSNEWENCLSFNDDIEPILDKMKELEGSDSDVKN